ncbi:MAG: transporter substrate-binding domain-containing protein [Polyangiaceae bacterium]|nr:transporter substrate-binding domain-containing protein [Polyangiaceae bacterium]
MTGLEKIIRFLSLLIVFGSYLSLNCPVALSAEETAADNEVALQEPSPLEKESLVEAKIPVVARLSKETPHRRQLIVATKEAPPFSFRNQEGEWSGISIDLWKDLAHQLGLKYELKEYDIEGLLRATENRDVDAAVAAISVTSEREKRVDFTHSFFYTGLGIAVGASGESNPVFTVIRSLFSSRFLGYLAGLIGVLFVIGIGIWLLERRATASDFSRGPKGIWDGFWWSAVTMTTVGYGDAAPKTALGRVLGLIWMFAAIIIISFFTAGIASSITVNSLETRVKGPADLPHVKVGTLTNSSAERYLRKRSIRPREFASVQAGLEAAAKGEVDAFVHDRAILQYYRTGALSEQVTILDVVFNPQNYGIALPTGSWLREEINTELLKHQSDEVYWQNLTSRYLGP